MIIRDIARRKRLEEIQRRLATAVDQTAEAVIVTNAPGEIQYVNPAFERGLQGTQERKLLARILGLLKQWGNMTRIFYKNLWETIKRGEVWIGRFNKQEKGWRASIKRTLRFRPYQTPAGRSQTLSAVKRDVHRNILRCPDNCSRPKR